MRRRGGWTLIELLTVVGVLAAMVGITAPTFKVLLTGLPEARQAVEISRRVRLVLRRMRDDLDAGRSLPAAAGEAKTGPHRLLIETPEGVVCYERTPGTVSRRVLAGAKGAQQAPPIVWRVPRAEIDWQVRRAGGRAVGVEVRTCVVQRVGGRVLRKLANAHVLFLAAGGGGTGQ